jgi:hypothetical protein
MKKSASADKLRSIIEKAIDDHVITRDEYDLILHTAAEDGHVDREELALLEQLQDMVEHKIVKLKLNQ